MSHLSRGDSSPWRLSVTTRLGLTRLGPVAIALILVSASASLTFTPPTSAAEPEDADKPKGVALIETAERSLIQLDVTVRGSAEIVSQLTAADFELVVGGRPVDQFTVDSLCKPNSNEHVPTSTNSPNEQPASTMTSRTSYLFYFDQHHLTMYGRQNAIDTARILIPQLAEDGGRVSLVSAGQRLETVSAFTDSVPRLLDALDGLEQDRTQWDDYPYLEKSRRQQVLQAGAGGVRCGQAQIYQREDVWHTEKAMRLLSLVLSRLADTDPPKIVIYFGDTARINAGAHYFELAGRRCNQSLFDAQGAFDKVIEQAGALGVRIYAIQAQGLVGLDIFDHDTKLSERRVLDAQGGLKALGLRTGGDAFINGMSYKRMVRRILDDIGCIYLLSFDADDYPRDKPLSVAVRVSRRQVRVQSRDTVVVQSESAHRTSRLLAAFGSPESMRREVSLQGVVAPLAFAKGRFSGLLQISVNQSSLSAATWDVGASVISRGRVRHETSGRISVSRAEMPVVLEAMVEFRPGPYEIVMVAHEAATDHLGALRIEGEWPGTDEGVSIPPIALMQPASGVFVRDGNARDAGSLFVGPEQSLQNNLPIVIVGLVCRGSQESKTLIVQRSIAGVVQSKFDDLEVELVSEACAQIRDVIPGQTLSPGKFEYRIRAIAEGRVAAERKHSFSVMASRTDNEPDEEIQD